MTTYQDLHLSPPIAAALERLGWDADDPALREVAPTAARGHNLVQVAPPSPAYAVPALAGALSRLGEGTRGLLLCADAQLGEWGAAVTALAGDGLRIQVAREGARAMRRLKTGELDLLVAPPETALALHARSALRPEGLGAVMLAWPEQWESAESIPALMQDLDKDAQRLILTTAATGAADLVERYARRALTVGETAPAAPNGPVRTVGVSWDRRVAAPAEVIEALDPDSAVIWTADRSRHDAIARALPPGDATIRIVTGDAPKASAVIAFDLPTADRLRQLLAAGPVVLLVPPGCEPYVERLAEPRRPLRLPGAWDAAASAAAARRAAVAKAIEEQPSEAALLTLAPLFERYDASRVAAALYRLWTTTAPASQAAPVPEIPATARVFVGIGKKDGATVNDLVAVLTKDLRVKREKIGRVELRDSYALVELPAQEVEKVAGELNGVTIRRKRISARVDRGPAKRKPRERS